MRYRLRTLVILTAIGPPLLAAGWRIALWLDANPLAFAAIATLVYLATWIIGPVAWYRELVKMVCGPEAFAPLPRKTRRHVRFRIERYVGEST